MSSRALRRLQNDDDLLESILSSAVKTSSKAAVQKKATHSGANIFALMNEDDEDSNEKSRSDHGSEDYEAEVEEVKPKVIIQTKYQKLKNKKKKQKAKKKLVEEDEVDSDEDDGNDEEFDKVIQQFQKKNAFEHGYTVTVTDDEDDFVDEDMDDEFLTASDNDENIKQKGSGIKMGNIYLDTAFSNFSIASLKRHSWAFNTDSKKLDPHTEFKLLFDDISAESLEDIDSMSSTSISVQQLKQIQRMKRLVKNWGGRDHRSVPNGPGGSTRRLQFTKVREDWPPTQRAELSLKLLNHDDLLDWQLWQRPTEWKDIILDDLKKWERNVNFFKFEALNSEVNKKASAEFYFSVVLHPDHEALISIISSKYPYHVPGLLQIALVMVRQGDRSNTNGLIQRALFVFDRVLRNGIDFDAVSLQLPYIYFYNRQFYLAILRYIQMLSQRGAIATASEWCKSLWSLSPSEDPLGCRYFIDYYLLLNNDYQYLIKLSYSPLMVCYKQWYTLGLSLGIVLSYLHIDEKQKAAIELRRVFKYHARSLALIYTEKLLGDATIVIGLELDSYPAKLIETKAYLTRFSVLWKNGEYLSFLLNELTQLFGDYKNKKLTIENDEISFIKNIVHPFYIKDIPVNLLRFVLLSDESSVIASIPEHIWSDNEIYEFDILPPVPTSRESADIIEKITSFINESDMMTTRMEMMQDEDLLNQVRQLSLDHYLQENPNVGFE